MSVARSSERAMSVMGGALVWERSRPGTWASIMAPGLKPSLRFHSAGSMGLPKTVRGIAAIERSTRLPVAVSAGTVK
jgi:hypothetical protein